MDSEQRSVRIRTGLYSLCLATLLMGIPLALALAGRRSAQEAETRQMQREAEEIREEGRRMSRHFNLLPNP